MQPKILILRAAGINCDEETAAACEIAGGQPERIHVNQIAEGSVRIDDYAALVIPGGFSYGDHLGAGKLLAVDLLHRLREPLQRFVEDGKPVLGICNGFQVLVKSGLLPGSDGAPRQTVTLTENASGHYECRWVRLRPAVGTPSLFLRNVDQPFNLPVGHGEGRLVAAPQTIAELDKNHLIALRYVDADNKPALHYPDNPNGSADAIAGITNRRGNVLGLMPHPDRAYLPHLHPDWRRSGRAEGDGLQLFRNMVDYVK